MGILARNGLMKSFLKDVLYAIIKLYTGNTTFKRILHLVIMKLEFLEFRVFTEFVLYVFKYKMVSMYPRITLLSFHCPSRCI